MTVGESDTAMNYRLCMKDADTITLIRVIRLKRIGHINRKSDTRKVKQIFNSQLGGVRKRGRPRSRWRECVWTDIKKGRITNWRHIQYLGIGKNGRRSLRGRRPTGDCRAK
jgi:hypothetical protein